MAAQQEKQITSEYVKEHGRMPPGMQRPRITGEDMPVGEDVAGEGLGEELAAGGEALAVDAFSFVAVVFTPTQIGNGVLKANPKECGRCTATLHEVLRGEPSGWNIFGGEETRNEMNVRELFKNRHMTLGECEALQAKATMPATGPSGHTWHRDEIIRTSFTPIANP